MKKLKIQKLTGEEFVSFLKRLFGLIINISKINLSSFLLLNLLIF